MATGEQSDDPRAGDASDAGFALESLVAPRSRFSRFAALAGTLLLIMSVLVGLLFSATHDPAGAIDTLLQVSTPTPAAAPMPGDSDINFIDAVPWGALRIDGKRIDLTALARHTFSGIAVSRGSHHLVYQASDFPTLRCDFTVPLATSDNCPLDSSIGGVERISMGEGRTIDLGATADRLPSSQRDALLAEIETQLKADQFSATIAPGDRYLDPQGDIATASEPLTLTLTLTLSIQPAPPGAPPSVTGCTPICPDNTAVIPGLGVDNLWHIDTALSASWALTDASGQSLGPVNDQHGGTFVSPGENADDYIRPIGVALSASGWQISELDGLTAQAAITAQENTVNQAISQHLGVGGFAMGGRVIGLASNPLQGCFVIITPPDNYRNVTIVARFGAAFVIDDAGHPVYSQMEHANATEVNVMNTLIQQGVPQTSF